jgi:streptogrisin C
VYDIRGGDEFNVDIGNGYVAICSVGFAVSGGFVSAGHCGTAGQVTSGSGVGQGYVKASVFPGNDWSWIQVNSSWNARPVVDNYSGGTVPVAGSQEAATGSSICRSGRTTGWRCGTISAKNVTVNYSGQYVYGLTSTSACAQPGDSGGSFISGNQAQGVTSGAGGDCSNGGTTIFQPVNPILSTYNLVLVTSGSTGRIVGLAGKCIDVPNGTPSDSLQLQLYTCNGTGAQDWTFAGDGSVRGMGLCLDVQSSSTADGAHIQLYTCNGSGAQKWVLSAAGDLVNPQANKCVDVTGGNSTDGTKLQLYTCNGTAAQKWSRG